MTLQFPTRAEGPVRQPHIASVQARLWAEFLYHDAVVNRLFDRVIAEYAEFQFYVWNDEREEVVGVGNAIPAAWDGEIASFPDGVDEVVEALFDEGCPTPNVLCALQVLIAPKYRGQGSAAGWSNGWPRSGGTTASTHSSHRCGPV
jgi:GNAT superfamily N-acetyltransferase